MSRNATTPPRRGAPICAVAGLLISVLLLASVVNAAPPATEKIAAAPVVIDGVELFRVRGVSAYPAKKRAQVIAARIKALAADPAFSPNALGVTEVKEGSRIAAGDQLVLFVLDEDAQLEQADRKILADVYVKRIAEAIKAYRRDRTPEYQLRSTLYAFAATLGLGLFLWLGGRALRRLDVVLDRRVKAKLEGLEAQSLRLLSAAHLWSALRGLRKFVWTLAVLIVIVLYLEFLLQLFPWTRSAHLLNLAVDPLIIMGQNLLAVIPDLMFLVVLVFVTRYVLKAIRLPFTGLARGTMYIAGFDREWAWPTYRMVRLLVIALAVVVAYPHIPGSGSNAFQGVSIFLGVLFSLGSQSVISNVIAGYSMIYRRAFRTGDRVRIDEYVGNVTESRLLVTHLRTPKNEQVVIPNSLVLNSSIVNYSSLAREGRLILHTTVGIGYETSWRQVEAMLLQAAERTEGVAKEPKPFVLQKTLGDFCVTYEINVYCGDAHDTERLYTRLHQNILDLFNEYGVQIMTPAYETDPQQPKIVPKEQWYSTPARPVPAEPE